MARTNLATRPFYNERAVRVVLGILALLVIGFSVFNVVQVIRLSASQSRLGAQAEQSEAEAARLRGEAARIRTQIDPAELQAVASAAREANVIIDRRAFSWSELLTQFERTLPPDVRITTVQPRLEKGVFTVGVVAEGRRVEDLDAFIEALEKTGTFRDVLSVQEVTTDDGLIQAAIQGIYSWKPGPQEGASGEGAGR